MPFPATLAALEEAGWKRSNYGRCKGCRDSIEWWWTPNGERMPMQPMATPESEAISHWARCGTANQFRKKGPQSCQPDSPTQSDLFAPPQPSVKQPKKESAKQT